MKGRKGPFVGVPTANGGLYFSVDVPGVCGDGVDVLANENTIRFYAENKNVYEHDESGRVYLGSINSPSPAPSLLSHTIAWDAEYGVLKVVVAPPPPTTTTNNNDDDNNN